MAGGDPLDELISRDPDAVMSQIQAKRRYLRDRRRQRKIADRQGFVDAQSTLESLKTGGVESIMDDKPVKGTGDLRKAEADAAPQFETIEDFEKYVNEQESEIKKTRELFDAYVEETKNLDPRKDHRTIKQRAEVIKQNAKSLKDAEKWLNDSKAATQAAKSKQEVAEDPTFWQKAMGTVADVAGAPVVKDIIDILSAPQAKLAGIASLAAETVSGGDQFASSGTKLGFGDLASAATDFTGQGKLAERGREFNEKVGSVLGTAEAMAEDTPVLGNVLDFAQGGLAGTLTGGEYRGVRGAYETVMGAAGVDPEQARDLRFQIANEFVTDPLMLADAAGGITKPLGQGYNALKSTRVGRQVIAKFPQALVPEKAWLRLQGFAKKSHALGKGEKFEDMVVAQQAFERDAGYVVEKFKQDVASRQAEYLNKLKGLPTEEADRVRESVPLVVEYTDPTTRANLLVSARERGDAASELLYQMADDYASDAEAIKAIENGTLNMHVKDLADDVNYLGRRFRPEVNDIIAHNPDARELLFNAKMESSSKAFQNGWLSWERGRKLRGMDFKEAEETVRQSLRKAGVPIPDDMPIFSRDVFGDLITRADKSLEKSNLANLYQTFSESFGKLPDGAEPMIKQLATDIRTNVPERAAESMRKASAELQAALDAQREFREGRTALRSVSKDNGGGVAGRQATELERAAARADEVRGVGAESQQGSKVAYATGREAQERAVPVAEALVSDARSLVASTPGATEARQSLSEARKLLKSAKKQEDLEAVASLIARTIGAPPAKGAQDAVEAAKALVKYTQDYIANNPAIKNADKALRRANKLLTLARETAARVETSVLGQHVDALLRVAIDAVNNKGIGASYLPRAMKKELEKAKRVLDDVTAWYKAKDAKAAGDLEIKMPDVKSKSVRDVRKSLSRMRAELRKDAPKALSNMLDRAYRQAKLVADRLDIARGAVGKDVATAVNRRVSQAQKKFQSAIDGVEKARIEDWTPEAMAKWFSAQAVRRVGVVDGAENALDILIRAKAPLPKTPEEIARLSMTFVSKKDAKLFSDYARAHYWKHIDTPGKFWSVMDAIKGVYQRAVLGRPSSLAKDFQGTMINGAMSGNTPYLERALKQLGNQKQWKQGGKKSDIVARLRGEGVLRNIVSEVEETRGTFRRVAMQLRTEGAKGRAKVLEKLSPLEEKGVIGGGLELAGAKKAGAKVGKATDYIVEARAYTEELNRLATYMKAVDNGAEHADAVEEVYRIWGKFNEMTRFDRDVMSRALFFWTWWARSIPITIRHLLDRPVKSRLLLTMMAGNVTSDEDMPPWLRRMGGAMLGRDQSGNAKVLNVAGGTYFQPMTSLLQGEMVKNMRAGNMAQAAVGAGKDMLRSAPPYVSEPLGAAFEQDMFTGRDWWRDKNAKTGSQIRAPMAFRWLLDTEIGNVLGLKENNQDGELRYITMDPYWATLIGMTPGLEPVMADVSSFTDPRQEDVAGGVSLTKGLVRQAGLPLYSVPMDDRAARNVREGQTALKKAIDKNAPALAVNGDYVYANESTTRGAKLKADWERYEAEARAQGHSKGSDQFKAYVASQLQRDYPGEFRYIDIGEKLRFLNQMQKNGEVLPLNGLDLRKSDRVKERITTQDMAEQVRKRTR